jgi:hypothetical protein
MECTLVKLTLVSAVGMDSHVYVDTDDRLPTTGVGVDSPLTSHSQTVSARDEHTTRSRVACVKSLDGEQTRQVSRGRDLCVGVQVDQLTQARSAPAARATPRGSGMCRHEQGFCIGASVGRASRMKTALSAQIRASTKCVRRACVQPVTVRRPRVSCNKAVATCAALTITNELKASSVCVRPFAHPASPCQPLTTH